MPAAVVFTVVLLCGCGGAASVAGAPSTATQVPAPAITTAPALNGAVVISLSSTASGATIYYTLDGSAPSTSSSQYFAPFLLTSNLTVKAVATTSGGTASAVTSQSFTPSISSGTLVWSDEFDYASSVNGEPDPKVWIVDFGNTSSDHELETYCPWNSNTLPCNSASRNAYIGTDGFLHIVARQPSPGVYTSGRLKSLGLFSFQYGRIEARMKLPESQGMWPAFWLVGNSIVTIGWPACGELDVMEHIDGSNPSNEGFDWVQGSIHGSEVGAGTQYHAAGFSAADWHTYGMIWTKGQVQYYIDDPANVYATYKAGSVGGAWPFDSGPEFLLLNMAVGGDWPGPPDSSTQFPAETQVDYVRLYTN
jgi:beta-glucanase (GH16 family)